MATKGFLSKVMNAASEWLQTEFPSPETREKLREQGWKSEFKAVASIGMHYPVVAHYEIKYTPEGKVVTPGSEEQKRYDQAVRDIVRAQKIQP